MSGCAGGNFVCPEEALEINFSYPIQPQLVSVIKEILEKNNFMPKLDNKFFLRHSNSS